MEQLIGKIHGCDVLSAPEDAEVQVIANETFKATGHTSEFGKILKKPAIDVLFSHDFEDMDQAHHILSHLEAEKINIFTAICNGGALVGQRSVISGSSEKYFFNDTNHSNHTYRVFANAERRNFESLHLVPSGDGYELPQTSESHVHTPGSLVVLTAMEHDNYGAFLLRALPKIIAIRELGIRDVTFLAPLNNWQRKIFSSLGFNDHNTLEYDRNKTYSADHLIIPSMRTSEFFLDDSCRVFFSEIAERTSFSLREGEKHEKLYVSRISQGLNRPDYRFFQNESLLVERLSALGFHIYEPERHSFEDQVATFNAARIVVGPSGAGMFNSVFCKPGTTIVSLEPMLTWLQLHTNLFSSMGHNYGLVLGGSDKTDPSVQKRWSTDVERVMDFLNNL